MPISHSPLKLVRIPGRGTSYEIVDYPNFDGSQLEMGRAIVAVGWQDDDFFLLLPSGEYVSLYSFTYTKDDVVWSTQEILPKVFAEELTGFHSELQAAEHAFAPLRASWDVRARLSRARAELHRIEKSVEAWGRIYLPEATKRDLLRGAELFESGDAATPQHLLLRGPSGTGATLIERAIAETTDCEFQSLSLTDLKEPNIGASVQRVNEVWEYALSHQPSIIFVDKCDQVFARQVEDARDVITNDIVQAFRAKWDGIPKDARIWVIGATSHRDPIDEDILAAFGAEIVLKLPVEDDRQQILAQEIRELGLSTEVPREAAARTAGMSGRDLKHLASTVRMLSYPAEPSREHFFEAIGAVRRSRNIDVDEKAGWETLFLDDATLGRLKRFSSLFRDAEKWRAKGVSVSGTLLLVGPSGADMREVADALANESGSSLVSLSSLDIEPLGVGERAKAMKGIFERARSQAPSILFLDGLDSIAADSSLLGDRELPSDNSAAQFREGLGDLVLHDNQVFVVAATSRPERVDPGVLSWFQESMLIPIPDRSARIGLLTSLLVDKKISFPLDDGTILLADLSEGRDLNQRDLRNWVKAAEQSALMRAVQDGGPDHYSIVLDDFDDRSGLVNSLP
jgi:transitional endoplasmic reticulum ATPase